MSSYSIFEQKFFKYKVENHKKYKHRLLTKYDIENSKKEDSWNCNVKRILVNENDIEEIIRPVLTSFCYEIEKSASFHDFDCWINFYEEGDYQELHNHLYSQLSLVYFLNYNPNTDSDFYFYDNNSYVKEVTEMSNLFSKNNSFQSCFYPKVREGDIIIFPSYMLHGVRPQSSDNLRITLSGNLKFSL